MRLRDEDVDEREGNALEDGEVGDWEGNHRPRKRHYDEYENSPDFGTFVDGEAERGTVRRTGIVFRGEEESAVDRDLCSVLQEPIKCAIELAPILGVPKTYSIFCSVTE